MIQTVSFMLHLIKLARWKCSDYRFTAHNVLFPEYHLIKPILFYCISLVLKITPNRSSAPQVELLQILKIRLSVTSVAVYVMQPAPRTRNRWAKWPVCPLSKSADAIRSVYIRLILLLDFQVSKYVNRILGACLVDLPNPLARCKWRRTTASINKTKQTVLLYFSFHSYKLLCGPSTYGTTGTKSVAAQKRNCVWGA